MNLAAHPSFERRSRAPDRSSMTITGSPVSSISRRSRSRSKAPPPVGTMPRSAMSAPSSGGVCSRAILTGRRDDLVGAARPAPRGSRSEEIVKLRGMPSARLRALTSTSRTSEPGKAETDLFLDVSAVVSPMRHAVVAADVIDDGFVELVATDPHRAGIDHAAERDHPDLGRTAADIDHHQNRFASATGRPAPIAAAMGSSIVNITRLPLQVPRRGSPGARPAEVEPAGHADDDPRTRREQAGIRHL